MVRRLTTLEKGKGLAHTNQPKGCRRIRAPDFDNSALIQANINTLIGRLTNTRKHKVSHLPEELPKLWILNGNVYGSDLDFDTFQLRFELEEDLQRVLENMPYHSNSWMVILQIWEPIISPSFPSQIPFWIRLRRLPLHFWHEKIIYDIGQDL